MRKLTLVLIPISIIFFGCATSILYSAEEQCAFQGLKLQGMTISSASAHAYNYNSGSTIAFASGNDIRCETPKTDEEKYRITNLQRSLKPKISYNDNIKAKKLLTGLGYVFYIAPGIGAKYYYDSQRDEAIQESKNLLFEELSRTPSNSINP